MAKIVLSAGHYGHETGASCGGSKGECREEVLNEAIVVALKPILEGQGHTVLVVPPEIGKGGAYSARGQWAADQKANLFIDIHHDSGGGHGCTGVIDHEAATQGRKFSLCLCDALAAEFNYSNRGWAYFRGDSSKHLGVLSGGSNWAITDAACLIECGFVDGDYNLLVASDYPKRAAIALATGCHIYLGLPVPASWNPSAVTVPAQVPELTAYQKELATAVTHLKSLGISDGSDPTGPATRDHLIIMLHRALTLLGK